MDERQILLDAKELITRKQYQEARRVLQPIAHNATAQKWLAKLDEIAPAPKVNPFDTPDNPFADPHDNPFWSPAPTADPFAAVAPQVNPYANLSDEEKFEQVKTLLKQKDYDAARQILITLPDDPAAQKLLFRLNQVAPPAPIRSFGTTPSAPRPSNPPISDPFGAADSSSGPADSNPFAASYEIIPTKSSDPFGMSALDNTSGYNRPVTTTHRPKTKSKEARRAEAESKRSLWMACLVGFVFACVMTGGVGTLGALGQIDYKQFFGKGASFKNDDIELTYSNNWRKVNTTTRKDCQNAVGTCLLFLESRRSPTAVMVQDLPLGGNAHQTIVDLLWQGYVRANYGLHMVGEPRTFKLDGTDAVQWYMTWHSTEGLDMYGMVLYMPTAHSVIELGAWSNSQSIFSANYSDVQDIIDSIDIKNPPPS